MEFTEAQKQSVTEWAEEGCGLSDIQKKLAEDFGIILTYMDVRFLVIDLGLKVQDKFVPSPSVPKQDTDISPGAGAGTTSEQSSGLGGVSVEVDRITRPGSIVSGTVIFSDGVNATWVLDQLGRLALDPGTEGYSPGKEDMQAFQQQLKGALEKSGF